MQKPHETIRYEVSRCSLGWLLVAVSAKGLCLISMGENAKPLLQDARRRFPKATLQEGVVKELKPLLTLIEHPGRSTNLTLDVRGTAFQKKVWQALQSIPAGETATYAEIAKRIRMPKAFRAVAQACGANNLAVVIPCHRVVRSDGALSGYRWGIKRKKELLKREGKTS